MTAVTIIPAIDFREGRWLNGMGVSWDIAAEPPGAGMTDFGWRFAIARIDADVPFSRYRQVDRVFTLIDGEGLGLDVAGQGRITVHERFVPHRFVGDAETSCTLKAGPCRALNLFLKRGSWRAEVAILNKPTTVDDSDAALLFALQGDFTIGGERLRQGDAAVLHGSARCEPANAAALLYTARLFQAG